MSLSTNNFALNRPTKSGNTFANADIISTNTFSKAKPTISDNLFLGDNISGTAFGGSDWLFGSIYGSGEYGGYVHFKNRDALPTISHVP